jgi:hypothetical protein
MVPLSIGIPPPFEVDTFIFTEPLNVVFDETANVHGSPFFKSTFTLLAGNKAVSGLNCFGDS